MRFSLVFVCKTEESLAHKRYLRSAKARTPLLNQKEEVPVELCLLNTC